MQTETFLAVGIVTEQIMLGLLIDNGLTLNLYVNNDCNKLSGPIAFFTEIKMHKSLDVLIFYVITGHTSVRYLYLYPTLYKKICP